MSLAHRVAYNTFIQIVGKALSTALGVVAVGLMTRGLGPEGFGHYTTIIAFLQFFGILVDFGLTITTMQMIAVPGADTQKILNNMLTLRIVTAAFFLACAPLIALFFPYSTLIKEGIALATLSFLAVAVNQVLTGYYQKELRTTVVAGAEIVGRCVLIAGLAWSMLWHGGLLGALGAVVAGSVINTFLCLWIAHARVRLAFAFDWLLWRRILALSWPIALSIFFNLIYLKGDTIILSLTTTQTNVGLYGAPYRVLEILATFPYLFMGLLFPLITHAVAAGDRARVQALTQRAFDALAIITLPLVLGTLILATPLMLFIAGPSFAVSGALLQILILATGCIFFGVLFGHLIVAVGKQRTMITGYAATAAIALLGYSIFIPKYSFWGAAWMTLVAEAMILLLTAIVSLRALAWHPNGSVFIRAALASAVMATVLSLLPAWHVLIHISIGAAVYAMLIVLFGGLKKDTIQELLRSSHDTYPHS